MTRVLILGTGPLLEPGVRTVGAHCLRTWHLAKPLLDAGHEVLLYTIPIFDERLELQQKHGVAERRMGDFAYRAFLNGDEGWNLHELERAAAEFRPEALVAANSGPAAVMARMAWCAPMWADLYGSAAIEAVAKARVYGTNALLGHFWEMEASSLRRADRFSTVSMRQLYALHGELAAVGRLNRHTFAHSFAVSIPSAFNPEYLAPPAPGTVALRGARVPADAFVALWSGAYNAWAGCETMMRALETAMERCPGLHYVSTGGAVHGHDDLTYARFEEAVRASRFRDRFHLLGWVDAAEVPAIMATADLGLCIDTFNHESVFGGRTRTVNMMAAGVPVLTTITAEISDEVARAGVALGCPPDDAAALAERLVWAVEHRDDVRALGAKGRTYVVERFGYDATTREYRAWIAAPTFAPDNDVKIRRAKAGENPFLLAINPVEQANARARAEASHGTGTTFRRAGSAPLRAVQSAIGDERYEKLRFLKEEWRRHRAGGDDDRNVAEELRFVFGPSAEAMSFADVERVATSLPPLRRLTIAGDRSGHPRAREIAALLIGASKAPRVVVAADPFDVSRIESFACGLLEDADLAGVLEVAVPVDACGEAFDAAHGNSRAWLMLGHTMHVLARIARDNPGRFGFSARTAVDDRNWRDMERLEAHLFESFGCRVEFSVGAPPPPQAQWDDIVDTVRRINRRRGLPSQAAPVAMRFAVDALRAGSTVESPGGGRTAGVLHSSGDIAACERARPAVNVRDYDCDFARAWGAPQADAMRNGPADHRCTHGCWLVHDVESTRAGLIGMARFL